MCPYPYEGFRLLYGTPGSTLRCAIGHLAPVSRRYVVSCAFLNFIEHLSHDGNIFTALPVGLVPYKFVFVETFRIEKPRAIDGTHLVVAPFTCKFLCKEHSLPPIHCWFVAVYRSCFACYP